MCHVTAILFQLTKNALYFNGNQACYQRTRHRYHGNHGLNGNHGLSQYGATTPPSEAGGGLKTIVQNSPRLGGGLSYFIKSYYVSSDQREPFRTVFAPMCESSMLIYQKIVCLFWSEGGVSHCIRESRHTIFWLMTTWRDDNTTFYDKPFLHMFVKHVNVRGGLDCSDSEI